MSITTDTEKKPSVRPCEGPCGRLTRPKGTPAIPGVPTMARSDGKYCSGCYNHLAPAAVTLRQKQQREKAREKDLALAAAFRDQELFLKARRERQARSQRRAMGMQLAQQQNRQPVRVRASA